MMISIFLCQYVDSCAVFALSITAQMDRLWIEANAALEQIALNPT